MSPERKASSSGGAGKKAAAGSSPAKKAPAKQGPREEAAGGRKGAADQPAAPGRSSGSRSRSSAFLVLGGRGVRLRLRHDRHPGPEQGLHGADDVRLLRRRQDRDRPVRQPEPHEHPAVRRTPARPGRGDRRRGPHLLHQQGHRPEGHPAGRVQQRARRLHAGRVDDHPAVRQGLLPLPGAHPQAQGEGGVRLPQAAAAAVQGRDPAGLPQHHLLRSRRLRHPGRRAGLLRQGRQGPQRPAGRGARLDPELPGDDGPGRRPGQPSSGCSAATSTSSTGWPTMGDLDRRQGRPAPAAAAVPEDQDREPVRRPEGPHAGAGRRSSCSPRGSPRRRSPAAASR